jgi:NAD+ diphosphatase
MARNYYSTHELDRCDPRRGDARWVAAWLADPATRVAVVWRDKVLAAASDEPAAHLVGPAALAGRVDPGALTLLGTCAGVAYFGLDASELADPLAELGLGPAARLEDLRKLGPVAPPFEASLLAYARAMAYWHRRHRFCGLCGSPTSSARAGHVRVCSSDSCGVEHFPRTDPAVIVLVTHGDACLLARQARWPPGRYSVLAGFVEPGEELEAAVAREVFEEAGVVVEDVRYHSSQPWPFPASLMVGFTARALERTLDTSGDELDDARWMTRDEVRAAVDAGELLLSPVDSISRRLVDEWLEG